MKNLPKTPLSPGREGRGKVIRTRPFFLGLGERITTMIVKEVLNKLSFRLRPESRIIKNLGPGLRRDDYLIGVS